MKKNIRRILALTMALCMVFAFSAFASAATNEASASGGTATSSVTLSSTTDGSLGGRSCCYQDVRHRPHCPGCCCRH